MALGEAWREEFAAALVLAEMAARLRAENKRLCPAEWRGLLLFGVGRSEERGNCGGKVAGERRAAAG